MDSETTDFGNGVIVTDWGKPEYLDGVRMRFMVTDELCNTPVGYCLAYFGTKEDAELFAQAKAKQKEEHD